MLIWNEYPYTTRHDACTKKVNALASILDSCYVCFWTSHVTQQTMLASLSNSVPSRISANSVGFLRSHIGFAQGTNFPSKHSHTQNIWLTDYVWQALRKVATFEYLQATIPLDSLEEQRELQTQSVQTTSFTGEDPQCSQLHLESFEEPDRTQDFAEKKERISQRFCWWREPSYGGWKISVDLLLDYIAEHGPFDGLLGFSQGSALICLALAHCAQQGLNLCGLKFAILFCGFVAHPLDCADMYPARIELPSLHIWGKVDAQVCQHNIS